MLVESWKKTPYGEGRDINDWANVPDAFAITQLQDPALRELLCSAILQQVIRNGNASTSSPSIYTGLWCLLCILYCLLGIHLPQVSGISRGYWGCGASIIPTAAVPPILLSS